MPATEPDMRAAWRAWLRYLVAVLTAAVALLGAGGAIPHAHAEGAPPTEANTQAAPDIGWTLAEGQAAVASGVISRVGAAPAVIDEQAVIAALADTDMRVIMLPFTALDAGARTAAGQQRIDLREWAGREGYELITVEGLGVSFSIFDAVPDDIPGISRTLAQHDVTADVLFAISYLQDEAAPPDVPLLDHSAVDPARVDVVADALAAESIYNDPKLASPQVKSARWSTTEPYVVRAAFFPAAPRGEPLPDLVGPLHELFPDDIVVVVHGRWLEVAGPRPDLLRSSLLWTYGYYMRGVLGWEVEPTALVSLFAERVVQLATGVTQDEPVPARPTDPVSSISPALPWIFGGTVLVVVVLSTAMLAAGQLRSRPERVAAQRAAASARYELGVRLATLAGQIVAIEPLVGDQRTKQGHAAAADLAVVLERYRVASETLSGGRVPKAASEAIREAERRMKRISQAVGVPLAAPRSVGGGPDEGRTAVTRAQRGEAQ